MSGEIISKPSISRWVVVASIIAVVAIPLLVYVMACMSVEYAASVAFGPNATPGPIPIVADWPRPLQDLQNELTEGTNTGFEAHLLSGTPGVYSVKEAVFRIECPKSVLGQITERLDLIAVDRNHERIAGLGELIVPKASREWWPRANETDVDYFVSQPMLDGEDGHLYMAAFDKPGEKLFVVYWFDF